MVARELDSELLCPLRGAVHTPPSRTPVPEPASSRLITLYLERLSGAVRGVFVSIYQVCSDDVAWRQALLLPVN